MKVATEKYIFIIELIRFYAKKCDDNWRQRDRKIDTFFIILFLIKIISNKMNSGYQIIIDEIWREFKNNNIGLPQEKPFAASSVCEARQKLDEEAIKEINTEIVLNYLDIYGDNLKWFGRRLFSIDGSNVFLPHELKNNGYGTMNPDMHNPEGKISCLYHIDTELVLDVLLESKGDERGLAIKHLNYLLPGDVIIYDRGYFGYALLYFHTTQEIDAIFRVSTGTNYEDINNFINDPEKPIEKYIEIFPSNYIKNSMKKDHKIVKLISIKLRLIRYIINNIEYCLATTVLDKKISPSEFKNIYPNRWTIEEHYKISKVMLKLEAFHSKTERGVKQELYTNILVISLSKILSSEANKIIECVNSDAKKKNHQVLNYVSTILKGMSLCKSRKKIKKKHVIK